MPHPKRLVAADISALHQAVRLALDELPEELRSLVQITNLSSQSKLDMLAHVVALPYRELVVRVTTVATRLVVCSGHELQLFGPALGLFIGSREVTAFMRSVIKGRAQRLLDDYRLNLAFRELPEVRAHRQHDKSITLTVENLTDVGFERFSRYLLDSLRPTCWKRLNAEEGS